MAVSFKRREVHCTKAAIPSIHLHLASCIGLLDLTPQSGPLNQIIQQLNDYFAESSRTKTGRFCIYHILSWQDRSFFFRTRGRGVNACMLEINRQQVGVRDFKINRSQRKLQLQDIEWAGRRPFKDQWAEKAVMSVQLCMALHLLPLGSVGLLPSSSQVRCTCTL